MRSFLLLTVLTFVFQDTEVSGLLQALRAREEIQKALSSPIPSASQIVKDAETLHGILHKDLETAQEARVRPEEHNHLLHLMTNIRQRIKNFPPEGGDIGPALHAARQVGYWSSVFISMFSNNTSTPTNVSTSLPVFTAPAISSDINPSLASQAPISSTINQATSTTQLAPSIQSSTTLHPPTGLIPSCFNDPPLPITTAPATLGSQAVIPTTISETAPTTYHTLSIQSPSTQHPPTSVIPSSFNHPALPISTALARSFGVNPSNMASQGHIPFTVNQAAPTSLIPSSFNNPAVSIPTVPAIPFSINPSTPASQALIPSLINQAAPTRLISSSTQSSTTQHPSTNLLPSSFNYPALPISTAPAISFGVNPSNMASQGHVPFTINQAAPTTHHTPSIQSSTTQQPPTRFIGSSSNHPALPNSTAPVTSPGINPLTLASQVFIPSAQATHIASASCTDPATMAVFREYGSGLLNEWLDSLTIPRNVENLQQVKEIWEVGNVDCPPLYKWTVVMRNYRTKTGKNSSMFSQRKYIYNLFKNCNFNENLVFTRYNELRPGKLYKILNSKSK